MFKLIPNPTFTAPVAIHRPGEEPADVQFTFKHIGESARLEMLEATEAHINDLAKKLGAEGENPPKEASQKLLRVLRAERPARMLKLATGWSLEEPFTEDNIALLLDNYPTAFEAFMSTYREQMNGAREKN